ncbi:MAG: hypothetical protein Q7N50_02580, partial [Armatimonadota bacterium]|nr:hypothetical protein [Armatimonadota bacterium]
VSLSNPVSACPERSRRAQLQEATAHWLVFEPFGFQARFASPLPLQRLTPLPVPVWLALVRVLEVGMYLRLSWLYSNPTNGSYS